MSVEDFIKVARVKGDDEPDTEEEEEEEEEEASKPLPRKATVKKA